MALCPRPPAVGLSRQTERGRQDGADSSLQLLTQHGREPRMSRQGNGGDNAVAERFLHTRKTAWSSLEDFETHAQTQTAVFEDIEVVYNRQRCHAANGDLAPLVDEHALKTREIFC